MKIAIYSSYPGDSSCPKGGIESVTVVLVKALARLDDLEVHVITLERNRTCKAIERDGDITVHRLPGSNWPEILDIFIGPGRRRLLAYVSELKPDVLHTHETYGLAIGGISIPHVHTLHGFDHANLVADSAKLAWIRSPLWKLAERRGLSEQKHIISITPYVQKMIEPLTNANIYEIDNPVNERFFEIRKQPEHGRILSVGWIDERKNTLGCVEAFAQIADRFAEAKLVIAGEAKDAAYLNRIQESMKKYAIADRVEMPGHINHEQLMDELAKASILLLPSRQENAPMAIAEAMAAGIAVITSNRCGMPYMVKEGCTGFLIDPESTGQIVDRLSKLIENEELCRKMGEAGRQMALERFHPHIVAEKTRAVYKRICKDI